MTLPIPEALFDRLVAFRRDLHRHPEVSWREERTARAVTEVLERLGIGFRSGVGGTGVIADLPGPPGSPVVALRADMDALPIREETGLPFASAHEGVMHACGHDGHTTMLIGAAELLAGERHLPAGIRLIFQPAEEVGGGARAVIEAGGLEGVGIIFGGHVDRQYEAGEFVIVEGPVNASTDEFIVELRAPGGHAARPHETADPIVAGSAIVLALQTIVTRDVDPTKAAVVSVGTFRAGSAPNIIASHVRLEGTLRAQDPEVRGLLRARVAELARAVAAAHRVDCDVELVESTPPVVNEATATAIARRAAVQVVGESGLRPMRTGNMGGEDFGFYVERVPGCFVRIGAKPVGDSYPAHSSRFTWDERALAYGAAYFHRVALEAARALVRTGS